MAVAALLATGCEDVVAGDSAPATTLPPSTVTATSAEAPDYSLARLCELMSPEEAQALGGSAEGEEGNSIADGHALCTWADETTIVVGWQKGTSTAQADTGPTITNTPTTIDGLPAVQQVQNDVILICEFLVDLPSGKLFAASASVRSAGEGKYEPCQVANQLANLIIPRVKDQ